MNSLLISTWCRQFILKNGHRFNAIKSSDSTHHMYRSKYYDKYDNKTEENSILESKHRPRSEMNHNYVELVNERKMFA